MKRELLVELFIPLILVLLLMLLWDPFGFFMPNKLIMFLLLVLIVIFIFFVGFIWKEKAHDERELLHRSIASRFAFLSGMTILVIGVIDESLTHALDPWLIFALCVMVIAKIAGIIYGRRKY